MKTLRQYLFGLSLLITLVATAQNESPDISLVFYIEEGTPNGTLIGTISATDPDGDDLTFSITSGNTNNAFALNSTSGDLSVNDADELIFAITPQYELIISVDDGNGGISVASVIINVSEEPLGLENEDVVRIYPNPIRSYFFIELAKTNVKEAKVYLYSFKGQKILVAVIDSSMNSLRIDTSHLERGVYSVVIEVESQNLITQRVILR